jgi:hypothetical protein
MALFRTYFIILIFSIILSPFKIISQINDFEWSYPINLEILNSKFDDFAPVWNSSRKILFFNSTRTGNSKFFISTLDANNSFITPKLMTDNLNNSSSNQSYITFDSQEESAYFTASVITKRGSVFNIFKTRFNKNNWETGELVKELSTDNFCFHPTIAPNGQFMIFSQASIDNPADADLWIAYRNSQNEWSTQLKLDELNSNGSEITPYLASNDTLYFASNGFNGKGGFDIYFSVLLDGKWQKPRPVNELNTEFDESDFCLINPTTAIFASNRPNSLGGLDLWLTSYEKLRKNNFNPLIKISTYVESVNLENLRKFILSSDEILKYCNNLNCSKELDLIKIFQDSLKIIPENLEAFISLTDVNESNKIQVILKLNKEKKVILTEKYKNDKINLNIDLKKYINKANFNDLADSIVIIANILDENNNILANKEKTINIFKATKEKADFLKHDNNLYETYIFPMPEIINEETLKKQSEIIQKIKNRNPRKRVIIESSPTYELTDNQKIRNWCQKEFFDFKDIIFQKQIRPAINQYFDSLNFNYLIVLIEK